ncbi:hypothetical protein J2W56_001062 [Nocardia kruczakiae]|uniref:DUF2889 family protein n=1 Tax=Nocardia kruczakiae TaxID=261477 RepID=A0ABU1XAK4_9NOCA|nr:DUF2889 domain-containing protein [Nocardia kruczakiae]MDR7167344.1 hypothetical protein [Nocardia kruczakiae]
MSADISIEVRGPVDASPPRRAGSVRRTTTIDMTWPGGLGTELLLRGRGRDLRTISGGSDGGPAAEVLSVETMEVVVAADRTISTIDTAPSWPELQALVGARSGSGYRAALGEVLRPVRMDEGPLRLLLDDLPGATLISGFAFSQWIPADQLLASVSRSDGPRRKMEGVCTGFMPGSSGLAPDGSSRWTHRTQAVSPLESSPDPFAWHEIRRIDEVSMRRARRMDVWADGGLIHVDAMFQDSATRPDGGRIAVHEYTLTATADPATGLLRSIEPVPRVLPYAECPLAVRNAGSLVGTPVTALRTVVLDRLNGVAGCTHLNDAMRALADLPQLAALI